jgi:FkbM family methyltransferase
MSGMLLRRLMRRVLPEAVSLRIRREWLGRRVAVGKGDFEYDMPLLQQFVKPADVCWDIGASSGTYAVALSPLASKVFAFEPVPHSFDTLCTVKRRAKLENVVLHQIAVSDRVGRAAMTVPIEGFYGGFYMARLEEGGEIEVEVSTIDALIARGIPEPDFIKCDAEGAEARIIEGARGLLARRRPIWLLETFDDNVVGQLMAYGYSAHTRDSQQRLVEVTKRTAERNYWFFPRG